MFEFTFSQKRLLKEAYLAGDKWIVARNGNTAHSLTLRGLMTEERDEKASKPYRTRYRVRLTEKGKRKAAELFGPLTRVIDDTPYIERLRQSRGEF